MPLQQLHCDNVTLISTFYNNQVNPEIVSSEEGPQQGDPIGPLLFYNTIHPLLSLQAHLTLGFLDDVTLGGPVKTVASDVAEIIRVGSELGLSLQTVTSSQTVTS